MFASLGEGMYGWELDIHTYTIAHPVVLALSPADSTCGIARPRTESVAERG